MVQPLSKFLQQKSFNNSIYLLTASYDDIVLKNLVVQILKKEILASGSNVLSQTYEVDRQFKYDEMLAQITTPSLFDDVTLFELNFKTKPNKEQQLFLEQLALLVNSHNRIIVVTDKLQKQDMAQSYLKVINAQGGLIVSMGQQDYLQLIDYKLKFAGQKLSSDAREMLLHHNLNNPVGLLQDLDIISYYFKPNSEIALSALSEVILDNAKYNIYNLSNAYLRGDLELSLKILDIIYSKTDDAILILWIIVEDLRKLLKIKAGLKQNMGVEQILMHLGVRYYEAINNYVTAEKRLTYIELMQLYHEVAEMDLILKGINTIDNPKQFLIKIMFNLCGKGNNNVS